MVMSQTVEWYRNISYSDKPVVSRSRPNSSDLPLQGIFFSFLMPLLLRERFLLAGFFGFEAFGGVIDFLESFSDICEAPEGEGSFRWYGEGETLSCLTIGSI